MDATRVDDLGRLSGRTEVAGSEGVVRNRGAKASKGTGRVGAAGSFPMLFGIRIVGPGGGEIGLDGAADEGVVIFVVIVVGPFLIVLSSDSSAPSIEKPRSIWENIAAVKSPIASTGSPCESAERAAGIDLLGVALW